MQVKVTEIFTGPPTPPAPDNWRAWAPESPLGGSLRHENTMLDRALKG